jgi:hypothetical protein
MTELELVEKATDGHYSDLSGFLADMEHNGEEHARKGRPLTADDYRMLINMVRLLTQPKEASFSPS